ncbi:MAG: bifunctional DNA-formamidopyrimidine glycosylase/DNA-(apurinic or apyrimidinic site) lyase, partial [Pseudomonadota bacterium]|nr:bifunctional DNA-formamidopyrimidine glycosylase/DNA-(apurinic or apyrimidinic site) lyase [Pseudomonadota bacterium]
QPSLRWLVPHDLARLQGQTLHALTRRAKYIVARFEQDALLMHLGMSGSFNLSTYAATTARRKHDHVELNFDQHQLRYHDPRRFGSILWLHEPRAQSLLAKLGVEPLDGAFDADYLAQRLNNKSTAIKIALMDNAVVVGVGNIYATEALFYTGIHPARPASTLTLDEITQLVSAVKRILTQAITLGGSSLRDYVNGQGETGYFQQTLAAYGRAGQACLQCGTTLDGLRLGQRASVFCPVCQPIGKNR